MSRCSGTICRCASPWSWVSIRISTSVTRSRIWPTDGSRTKAAAHRRLPPGPRSVPNHPRAAGGFNSSERGAWYAANSLAAAHAELIYHRTLELAEIGVFKTRVHFEYRWEGTRARRKFVSCTKLFRRQAALLHPFQRLLEIRQQVAPILDAHRNPHQPVADARLVEFPRRHARMRGGFRMAHQSLHSAE